MNRPPWHQRAAPRPDDPRLTLNHAADERPVALLAPPETVARPAIERLPTPHCHHSPATHRSFWAYPQWITPAESATAVCLPRSGGTPATAQTPPSAAPRC